MGYPCGLCYLGKDGRRPTGQVTGDWGIRPRASHRHALSVLLSTTFVDSVSNKDAWCPRTRNEVIKWKDEGLSTRTQRGRKNERRGLESDRE